MVWPGWNNADEAGWWSGLFFWIGAGSFLVLGASAVLSHAYGMRKDRLAALAYIAAAQRTLAGTSASPDISVAGKARTLTAAQKAEIEAACRPHPGQTFELQSVLSDPETLAFRNELAAVLTGAGWEEVPSKVAHAEFSRMPVGIVFILNKIQVEALGNNLPIAVQDLIVAMHESGVIPSVRSVVLNDSVPTGSVRLVIGAKP